MSENGIRHVNLALQGGGAHGAFTWGVLDRLLEQDGLSIEGVSGTSAGAMNGAVLCRGFRAAARKGRAMPCDKFWTAVSQYAPMALVHRSPIDKITNNWNTDQSPGVAAFEALFSVVSPYQLNPLNYHPLRPIIEKLVDFAALQSCPQLKLFVSATNVRNRARDRNFGHQELTADALIASACLPTMFQAVDTVRRSLLGWRLYRQSGALSAGL